MFTLEVAVPVPIFQTFFYASPEKYPLGTRVKAPFGRRTLEGFVVESTSTPPTSPLKSIIEATDDIPAFSPLMFQLFQWIADYYHAPLGEVIRAGTPTLVRAKERPLKSVAFSPQETPPTLTEEQKSAWDKLLVALQSNKFSPFLLHGVTGSGKTELYLRAFEEMLKQNQGGILLVPEIALTPQLVSRFEARFPQKIAVLHSGLSPAQKYRQWRRIAEGRCQIAIGARSAIFAPIPKLGVIVVDEEHEGTFKQEEQLKYHARDLALVRGKLENAVIILGSATPSLESFFNAQQGKYQYLTLTKRVEERPLPPIQIVNLKNEGRTPPYQLLSKPLFEKIQKTLSAHQQVILLLNRRGYAAFLLCEECGHVPHCPKCDVSLTVYKSQRALQCHYCRFLSQIPQRCPQCQGSEIKEIGVGTEQLEEHLHSLFPEARIGRLDRGVARSHKRLHNILQAVHSREIDILIGTQLVAKGHDFPGVTLVGVVLADISINLPDFRSSERTFQLLTQVAGRAGRGNQPGEVIIQTYNPEHPAIQAASNHDFLSFAKMELQHRKLLGFPPFGRLIAIKGTGAEEKSTESSLQALREVLLKRQKGVKGFELLGPSPAPIARLKNQFRWQMILRGENPLEIKSLIKNSRENAPEHFSPKSVSIHIDVDPHGLM